MAGHAFHTSCNQQRQIATERVRLIADIPGRAEGRVSTPDAGSKRFCVLCIFASARRHQRGIARALNYALPTPIGNNEQCLGSVDMLFPLRDVLPMGRLGHRIAVLRAVLRPVPLLVSFQVK